MHKPTPLSETTAQAALVDSLFFIGIVATICSGLFFFAINYGTTTESLLNSFYSSDFAMDSLKVVTYVTVLHSGTPVDTSSIPETAEYDYLLAIIKEDYAKSTTVPKTLSLDAKLAIARTLHSVLRPFEDSIDYAFYIAKESTSSAGLRYVALIIAAHKTEEGVVGAKRVFYACDPVDNKALEKYIFPYVGKVDSATGKITLNEEKGSASPFIIGLHTWVSKKIGVLQEPSDPKYGMRCEELNLED